MDSRQIWRVGEKVISAERLYRAIEGIMELRARGLSQQEAAKKAGVDRSFISRLESLGEVRRGATVAVVGFPVANKTALEQAARAAGAEFVLLLTNEERWRYARERTGDQLFNELMQVLSTLASFDRVLFLGSDMRIRLVEAILGKDRVVGVSLGRSPIREDVHLDPERLAAMVREVRRP